MFMLNPGREKWFGQMPEILLIEIEIILKQP